MELLPVSLIRSIWLFLLSAILLSSTDVPCLFGSAANFSNETDRLSLLRFKDLITDDPLNSLSSWNDTLHFCYWQGVTCSGRRHPQRVTALNLTGQNLVGRISPFIGNLSFLRIINLSSNSFYGTIPEEIGRLFGMRYLILADNTFTGEIPANLTHCSELQVLYLYRNVLAGRIPTELGSLFKLTRLHLGDNNLTGSIPPSLGNLSSLTFLSLSVNSLEGSIPDSFIRLVRLSSFALSQNALSGTIPPQLYNISTIKALDVRENRLYGNLPPYLGLTLPILQILLVGANQFTGPIPVSLSNSSGLLLIDLGYNSFTGSVPLNFGSLKDLRRLILGSNQLGIGKAHDLSFLDSLTNCSSLQILAVGSNRLNGALPDSISNLSTQLFFLSLGGNSIFGSIPSGIQNLVGLTLLDMGSNFLRGPIPNGVGKLNRIGRLDFGGNDLSGTIPSSLGNITQLFLLSLFGNNLWGNVPSSIGNCRTLQFLYLQNNNLSGPLAAQLFSVPSLIYLNLSDNSFIGYLPLEVGNLKVLGRFDVSRNKLSGEIPSSLGNCLSLEYVRLDGNFFQGTIPTAFITLRGLQSLDLSHNNLSGEIPEYLGKLLVLQYLNLSFNNFEGELPKQGVFGNASEVSVLGNSKLCGGIQELQLPPCSSQASKKRGKSLASKLKFPIIGAVLCLLSLSSFFTTLYWVRKVRRKNSVEDGSRRKPSAVPSVEDGSTRNPFAMLSAEKKSTRKPFVLPFVEIKFKRKSLSVPSAVDHFVMNLTYAELLKATDGFSSANLIGTGRTGAVYKGFLDRYEPIVAVKVFNLQRQGSMSGFMAECETLRNIRHRNIVRIFTCCSSIDFKGNDFKALIYEYMPHGSLDKWLHRDGHEQVWRNLNFTERLNIAIDVASALVYLRRRSIIHRDITPSNILLDGAMIARVGDFGLAKFLSEVAQTRTVVMMGSVGYIAPEYAMGGKPSTQGDVYSYGILLLEMITGKGPTDEMFKDDLTLHHFAKLALPERVMEIVDPRLLEGEEKVTQGSRNHINTRNRIGDCLILMVGIGVTCSAESPKERMDIKDVLRELHAIKELYLGDAIHRDRQIWSEQLVEDPSQVNQLGDSK
ncbi:putative receptor-like protein kinase At3g47110 [Magnolia sinica]|uniref:putative receptor-like protein kinase At3g47110 n=1 Tax=Magnolia sinica TaxID=86752 RepID=UPI00265A52BB|nr:putative receptor-like protein kinase At3g47110 [Magnolia sinica]